MDEIFVHSQEELDNISTKDDVIINVCFGTKEKPAFIDKNYKHSVHIINDSWVRVCERTGDIAYICAFNRSVVLANKYSHVRAYDNSLVEAHDFCIVCAHGNSMVMATSNSSVAARDNSSVAAYDNSFIRAFDTCSIEAYGNTRVCKDESFFNDIKIYEKAYLFRDKTPFFRNIKDFMDYYGISYNNDTAIFYKAVRKNKKDEYISDYDKKFKYEIGKEIFSDYCSTDRFCECGNGIHFSSIEYALRFGQFWKDLAILELKVEIKNVVVPFYSKGKARAKTVRIIREVPLEECGILGKVILRTRGDLKEKNSL